jgi:putative oxidoreductase
VHVEGKEATMRGILGIDPGWGLTVLRLAMALIFVHAGWQKFGAGMAVVSENFARMAIPAPHVSGPFIVLLEVIGGVLLLLGIFGRWLGLLYAIQFAVATFYVKLPAGWAGARLDLMLLVGGLAIFLGGPGRAALDAVWLEKRK